MVKQRPANSPDKEDDDAYVARLLAEDAKRTSLKYSSMGLEAILKPNNAPKPDTRFLRNILRSTDSHNAVLRHREKESSHNRLRGLQLGSSSHRQDRHSRRRREPPERDDQEDSNRRRFRDREDQDRHRHHNREKRHGRRERRGSSNSSHSMDDLDRRPRERSHRANRTSHRHTRSRERSKSPSRRRDKSEDHERDERHKSRHKRRPSRERGKEHDEHRSRKEIDRLHFAKDKKSSSRTKSKSPSPAGRDRRRTRRRQSPSSIHNFPEETQETTNREAVPDITSRSKMDAHFAPDYNPALDVALPDDDSDSQTAKAPVRHVPGLTSANNFKDDWDMALEALRGRAGWRSTGTNRLRDAGFGDAVVQKWKDNAAFDGIDRAGKPHTAETGMEPDTQWSRKGQVREWDRGKVVDDDGVRLKPAW